jgi:pyrrolidone-carboxylate peptidase
LWPFEGVLVTGFGPFPGVAWNPSGAYAATLSYGRVLDLAGAGDMAPVIAQLGGEFDVLVALGVDGRQRLARPRYTIETQSRGMGDPAAPWVAAEGLARAVLAKGVFGPTA